ncbi:MAG: ribosome recycling factor [Candidatus Vogelbacteria bacterium CG22_combo_CG10-13_8_21_14_all_37_9]|uniref:Ribosome recycling factor n=1 Tax=Candidatus Vogelbacteria bacterium CG22_combo_CG10-13_8_21_14_all_37_9 TaxID=1975046 RepID=A0A2H0BKS6_9BACT|nr:MAG: ribosome recycling factor [bacterium CG10_37_50]PIP58277.1 MAG: ribosome recycling factor [Candidatus Vogelbacteria bacterium CG22_combo_CG10-13_8_21_14_all_37_9]
MAYNFTEIKEHLSDIEKWLSTEFSSIRTGKATPQLLDSIRVESYGQTQALKHLASINIEDAQTLRVIPWDKGQIKGIETAIAAANLGISSAPDADGLRIIFPQLTTERRKLLNKLIGEKLEEARVSLRKEREKTWNDIQSMERNGGISDDVRFRLKEDLQKIIDDGNARFEAMVAKKRIEIEN